MTMIGAAGASQSGAGAPETKAGGVPVRPAEAYDDLRRAFEAFKDSNDERLAEIERRGHADVLLEEKVDRIGAALDSHTRRLDDLAVGRGRPPLEASAPALPRREAKAAFESWMRSGETRSLARLEEKNMNRSVNAEGGFLAPMEIEAGIGKRLQAISPIRSIATVRTVSSGQFRRPVMTTGPVSNWVAETASRPQTTSPVIDAQDFTSHEIYAMPAATPALLDDAAIDLEEWLVSEVEAVFAEREGQAFVTGNGTARPKGFLDYTTVDNASWTWGQIGRLNTGVAAGWPASNPSDILVDLIYALRPGYRQNASFVMNRRVQAAVRKFKDTTGHYLWQPPAETGGRASLMSFPLVEAEDMPDVAAASLSVAFGDFRRGYLIVDRQGIQVLRDPYSAKPYVLFYVTKRVGGGVQDFDAIKLLRFAV